MSAQPCNNSLSLTELHLKMDGVRNILQELTFVMEYIGLALKLYYPSRK